MKITLIIAVLICVMMSGIAVAEGDRTYGMMDSNCSECAECTDVMDAMENLPFAQFDAMATIATSGIVIEEKWAYGKRNYAPDGVGHVYWDFEEGSNLGVFKNAHPTVSVFENVSNSYCCSPCSDINEPSYVRKGASSGPTCRCIMYIYPRSRTYANGTDIPYIHILNGNGAFSPRVMSGWCYYPACSAFIAFKDNINYVSFLASTNSNLRVRAYDRHNNYLGSRTIYCTTDRIGDGPSNFTRFTIHMPGTEIGYLTFRGPFNGWHIDDMIAGGEFGHPEMRRDYSYAAERLKLLVGVPYKEFGIGFDLFLQDYLTAEQITDDIPDKYWDKRNKALIPVIGISDEAAIAWAFNGCEDCEELVNWADITDQFKKDFTEEVAIEDLQSGDVIFIDYDEEDGFPDGQLDEVGMYVGDTEYGKHTYDVIRITPVFDGEGNPTGGDVSYSEVSMIELLYGEKGLVYYRSLPDDPKGGHSPYPKIPTKFWI